MSIRPVPFIRAGADYFHPPSDAISLAPTLCVGAQEEVLILRRIHSELKKLPVGLKKLPG
jgi:hypothetical protein